MGKDPFIQQKVNVKKNGPIWVDGGPVRRLLVTSTENVAFRTRGKRSLRAAAVDPTSPPFYSNGPTKFPVFDLGMSVENESKRILFF